MGKKYNMLIIFFAFYLLLSGSVYAAPELSAKAAILIDSGTGRIIYEKNAHERLPQASTTKITTALLALEKEKNLKRILTVPSDFINPGEAGIWLEPGERHTLEDMLYALLLRSANDAAELIAISFGGSEKGFVEMMNNKVKSLGLKDTHYVNPHGLHDENHYSSAYDLAMIAREALTYDEFKKIIVTNRHVLPWGNHEYSRVVYNHNKLLKTYEGADGVKNGFTRQAGNCLVGSATKDGLQLIAVVLGSNGMYDEVGMLLDYGFENFKGEHVFSEGTAMGEVSVKSGNKKEVKAVAAKGITAALKKSGSDSVIKKIDLLEIVKAPVEKGMKLGTVTVAVGRGVNVDIDLIASETVEYRSWIAALWHTICSVFGFFRA